MIREEWVSQTQYTPGGQWYDQRTYPAEALTTRLFDRGEQRHQDILSPCKVFGLVHPHHHR